MEVTEQDTCEERKEEEGKNKESIEKRGKEGGGGGENGKVSVLNGSQRVKEERKNGSESKTFVDEMKRVNRVLIDVILSKSHSHNEGK